VHIKPIAIHEEHAPVALVLGTGDIASAIGRTLFRSGWGVAMLRDPGVPVLRRGMAFDDALEEGLAELDGVWAVPATLPQALPVLARSREAVVVANFDLAVVAATCPGLASVLIDSRMRKYAPSPDLRPLAACAIGIGPGFDAEGNVDVAIETMPGQEGSLVMCGATAQPTGRAEPLGGAAEERFVTAPSAGPWRPLVELGAVVTAGTPLGLLGGREIVARIGGTVRGVVRGTSPERSRGAPMMVGRGSKLAEIDPRAHAPCRGVPPRAQRIADGVQLALDALFPVSVTAASF
jgi:hypothetical protein